MPVIKEKHIARVVENQDPDKRGRLRVTCAGLMGDNETVLPGWVEPGFAWGSFNPPDIGELIEVECNATNDQQEDAGYQAFLENPDIRWTGRRFDSLAAGNPRPPDAAFTDKNYGKRRGLATPGGHVLMFDDTNDDKEVILRWKDGEDIATIRFSKDGIEITDKAGNMIVINGDDTIDVTAPKINHNANGAADQAHVRGNELSDWINNTLKTAAYDTHQHPTAFGPSGAPIVPLQAPPSTILSTDAMVK